MKIDQRVRKIWSGHENVTEGLTYEGHSYNPLSASWRGINKHVEFAGGRLNVSEGCPPEQSEIIENIFVSYLSQRLELINNKMLLCCQI